MIMLDEMNLARVEYYFSDFSPRVDRLNTRFRGQRTKRRRNRVVPRPGQADSKIVPGYNLLFAGTMNEDETTQSLSVIDLS